MHVVSVMTMRVLLWMHAFDADERAAAHSVFLCAYKLLTGNRQKDGNGCRAIRHVSGPRGDQAMATSLQKNAQLLLFDRLCTQNYSHKFALYEQTIQDEIVMHKS
jgi:hypothetical protein